MSLAQPKITGGKMIRFDDNLKKRVQRIASNVNRKNKYNKFKTRGKGMLFENISASDIIAKYSDKSRKELERQLKLYKEYGKRDSLNLVSPDSRLSKWEYNFFKANMDKTKSFYINEISDLERIIGNDLGQHLRINERLINLQQKLNYLDKDLSTLSENEIKTMRTIFNYAERSDIIKERGFRHYLNQLERTMNNLEYSKEEIDAVLNKFNVLSENEFTEMMRNEDLIDAVYDLIDSPKGRGKYELMTDENRARAIVEQIKDRTDSLIAKYKTKK